MEFLQLEYFRHAARTENFSHTAKHFMVPASSVSLTIKKLETELGTKLFDRYGNTVRLNEKGRIFLKSANNIFKELSIAQNNLNKLTGVPAGTINMLVMTNRRTITKNISEFREMYPAVSFVLDLSQNKNYISYDIIVTDELVDSESFYERELVNEELKIAASLSNPISAKKQIEMRSLKDEKFITFSPNHSLRNITENLCAQAGFTPNIAIECDDPFYICEYVKMGMGISLIPTYSWKNQFDASVSLVKVNEGVYRRSNIYTNINASYSASFFSKIIKCD